MSRKYKFSDNDKLYFISFAVVNWIDVFTRNEYKDVLIESWRFCQKNKDLDIYGWCIMTNHVHVIIGSRGRDLSKIVGEMKSYTSKTLHDMIKSNLKGNKENRLLRIFEKAGKENGNNRDWQFWQQNNKPLEIISGEMFYQKLNYIHQNPVKARLVENEEDYIYSSAGNFYDKKGLIKLSYIV